MANNKQISAEEAILRQEIFDGFHSLLMSLPENYDTRLDTLKNIAKLIQAAGTDLAKTVDAIAKQNTTVMNYSGAIPNAAGGALDYDKSDKGSGLKDKTDSNLAAGSDRAVSIGADLAAGPISGKALDSRAMAIGAMEAGSRAISKGTSAVAEPSLAVDKPSLAPFGLKNSGRSAVDELSDKVISGARSAGPRAVSALSDKDPFDRRAMAMSVLATSLKVPESDIKFKLDSDYVEPLRQAAQPLPKSPNVGATKKKPPMIYFVPNLSDSLTEQDVMTSRVMAGGYESQLPVVKQRAVVYLPESEAVGHKVVPSDNMKIKQGYVQVDAANWALIHNTTVSDMLREQHHLSAEDVNGITKETEIGVAQTKYSAGQALNEFATCTKDTKPYFVPLIISNGNNAFLASAAADVQLKDMLDSAFEKSKTTDPRSVDMASTTKAEDKYLSDRLQDKSYERYKAYDLSVTDKLKKEGFTSDQMQHLANVGRVHCSDQPLFRRHFNVPAISPDTIDAEPAQIVEGAGKFILARDAKDAAPESDNFANYIVCHREEILNQIGDELGLSEEEQKGINISVSSQKEHPGGQSCVIVYSGFDGLNLGQSNAKSGAMANYGDSAIAYTGFGDNSLSIIDTAVKNAINSAMANYGDTSIQCHGSYMVTNDEVWFADRNFAKQPTYETRPLYAQKPPFPDFYSSPEILSSIVSGVTPQAAKSGPQL